MPPPFDPTAGYGSAGYWNEQQPYGVPTNGPWAQTWSPGPRNDPLAVASLIVGLVSFFCLGIIASLVAIGLGVGALSRIRAQPAVYEGQGLAIAGIVVSGVQIVLYLLLLSVGATSSLFLGA